MNRVLGLILLSIFFCTQGFCATTTKTVNDLTELTDVDDNDRLFITDVSAVYGQQTKYIKKSVLTAESDPIFSVSDVAEVTSTDISNWDSAYGWGDHATEGYLKTEVDGSTTNEIQNIFQTVAATSGSTTANTSTDTLTVSGAGIASTAISGDTLTITATEADTLATVTGRGATTSADVTLTGNVGIGTTSVVTIDNNIIDFGDVTDGYVLTFDVATNTWSGEASSGGTIDGSGTQYMIAAWDDADTLTDSIIYDNGTNVGIGTTTTTAVLTVDGGVAIGGSGNCGIGTSAPVYLLEVNGTLQADAYYSEDGTVGVTATLCAGFKNGLCVVSGDE